MAERRPDWMLIDEGDPSIPPLDNGETAAAEDKPLREGVDQHYGDGVLRAIEAEEAKG